MAVPAAVWVGVGAVVAGAAGIGLGIATVDDSPDTAPVATVLTADGEIIADEPTPVGAIEVVEVVEIPMVTCPGDEAVGTLHTGDRIVATGRDDAGEWVAIRNPLAVEQRVWVEAIGVIPDDTFDALPVVACADAADLVAPSTTSTTSTTIPESTTTSTTEPGAATVPPTTAPPSPASTAPPAGTPPPNPTTPPPNPTTPPPAATTTTTTTTTTTVAPDTTGPSISASASPGTIIDVFSGLTCRPTTSTISASASDPSGIASITASWNFGGSVNRDLSGGSTTFGSFNYPAVPDSTTQSVPITITAIDGAGNPSTRTVNVTVESASLCFG